MMPSPRPRSARQARARLELGLGTAARANPLVGAWRWRYELLPATALAAVWLVRGVAAATAVIVSLAAVLVAVASLPAGRRFLSARAWCIVTAHRVRVGCAQAWIHSRGGKIPLVLLTRRQPFGERVYLWCRAGTTADDFSSARGLLAATCWADDVRVSRHPRYAHLVSLDVIRRPRLRRTPVTAGESGARDAGASLAVFPITGPADDWARPVEHHDGNLPGRQKTA
jgi:hypothetical protein